MDNALTLFGLMKKAGKLAIGAENAYGAAALKKAKLLVTASDASPHVVRQIERAAEETETAYEALSHTKAELGAALGQKECAAAAVTDAGLARAFLEKLGLSGSEADGKRRGSPDISAAGGKSKGGNC